MNESKYICQIAVVILTGIIVFGCIIGLVAVNYKPSIYNDCKVIPTDKHGRMLSKLI